MNQVFSFDIHNYRKGILHYIIALLLFVMGFFCGNKFNLSISESVYLNGSYTIGFMLGLISLSIVFIATVIGSKLLFKEQDTLFSLVLFPTPLKEKKYVLGRFASFYLITLLCFVFIVLGFAVGQNLRSGSEMNATFNLFYYLYPLLVFGIINALMVCSILMFIAFTTKNRMLVVIGGLLLYIFYMIALIYSGSPFMANALPQSEMAQKISAITDPFGLSSYFYSAKKFSVEERNTSLVPLSGFFLLNRLLVIIISSVFIFFVYRTFSFTSGNGHFSKKKKDVFESTRHFYLTQSRLSTVNPTLNTFSSIYAIKSFIKVDLIYIFKSVVLPAASALVLFHLGMEMYAEIEKGIRIPQQYASSGLMAQTIIENFYLPGVLLTVYFANDICWRSTVSGFSNMENSTFYSGLKSIAHWISINILIVFFSLLLIAEGFLFQSIYGYAYFDFKAYTGVWLFNTAPLMLLSGLIVFINSVIKNKYLALSVTITIALLVATPISKKLITLPIFRFFSGFNGVYSDFNGYGPYVEWFALRLLLGGCVIAIVWLIFYLLKNRKTRAFIIPGVALLIVVIYFSGKKLMKGYVSKDEETNIAWAAAYEKNYRHYQNLLQPTITDIKTQIDLYPSTNSYTISGTYIIRNLSGTPIDRILINFDKDLKIEKAAFSFKNQTLALIKPVEELYLNQPMKPNEEAKLAFKISYHWSVVNGHKPFNAIIKNGSFMRISRYYPVIGYQSPYEITDENKRKEFSLGVPTPLKKLEEPKTNPRDFINLDMTVSTTAGQTAIGTGELVQHWTKGNRNYFHYQPGKPVPFRFAVSSADYAVKTTNYNGISINTYYHPKHFENVEHLMNNAKQALDYCSRNFGPYPFKSITFSEISSFTSGFNATAYPAVIFMTEHMAFHANLKADKEQDVINELAGHELSHYWWGNNSQMSPDEREGTAMLSETFAMYTEMMIYKKLYGKEKMLERVKMHRQIYESEKGFSEEQPLYKVTADNSHISYSKGAVVMVELAQLIGEEKLNEVLRNFLLKYKYPDRPTTKDFLSELYQMTDKKYHHKIEQMFTETVDVVEG